MQELYAITLTLHDKENYYTYLSMFLICFFCFYLLKFVHVDAPRHVSQCVVQTEKLIWTNVITLLQGVKAKERSKKNTMVFATVPALCFICNPTIVQLCFSKETGFFINLSILLNSNVIIFMWCWNMTKHMEFLIRYLERLQNQK